MTLIGFRACALCALAALLAGCASMSEKQCRTVNWAERGERDAYDGQSRERLAGYLDACTEHGIEADVQAYNAGYARGLRLYCTPQRGYTVGMAGTSYRRICPPDNEPAFLQGYEIGRGIHGEQRRVSDTERQIREAESKLKAAQSAEERDALRRKIRDLDEERSLAQRRVRRLVDEAAAAGYQ